MGKAEDTVLIRDFRKSDLDDLLDLLPKCFAQEFEIIGFDPAHTRDMANRAFGTIGRLLLALSRFVGREPIKFLVAEANDRVIGTTMVQSSGKVGYISAVMVHPDYRRRGIATTLMRSAIEYIRERRMERAVLDAVSTNAAAISVYSKLGFEPFEQVANFVGETASVPTQGGSDGVETRAYEQGDLDKVYDLIMASEDPNHLRVYSFSKKNLKTPFWLRLLRFATQKRIVAVRAGKIVGYVAATYTTPKEAATIGSVRVNPQEGSRGVERALINAAVREIRKGGVGRIRATVPTTKQELAEIMNNLGFREALTMVGMCKEMAIAGGAPGNGKAGRS
jgi:ribosomal protein S18 acetylase RimI-like enzyme